MATRPVAVTRTPRKERYQSCILLRQPLQQAAAPAAVPGRYEFESLMACLLGGGRVGGGGALHQAQERQGRSAVLDVGGVGAVGPRSRPSASPDGCTRRLAKRRSPWRRRGSELRPQRPARGRRTVEHVLPAAGDAGTALGGALHVAWA